MKDTKPLTFLLQFEYTTGNKINVLMIHTNTYFSHIYFCENLFFFIISIRESSDGCHLKSINFITQCFYFTEERKCIQMKLTFPVRAEGISDSNLLLSPNLLKEKF